MPLQSELFRGSDPPGGKGNSGGPRVLYLVLTLIAAGTLFPRNVFGQTPSRVPVRRDAAKHGLTRKQGRLQISKINDPNERAAVVPHSQGEGVIRAAILLDRLKFSSGEITKNYSNNLRKAIEAFQSASGLRETGEMDSGTWTALNEDQGTKGQVEQKQDALAPRQDNTELQSEAIQGFGKVSAKERQTGGQQPPQSSGDASQTQAVITYIIALEDVTGPFTRPPRIRGRSDGERQMLREAKLTRLNFASSLDLLAEKFHSSPALLVELNGGKSFEKAGEKIVVPNVLTPDPPQAASVNVDGSTDTVTALDSNGKILAYYPASTGSAHDPLPSGNWNIGEITWYPKFNYNPNLFWDAEDKKPRATLPPGPRNPVGVVWIGLSKKHYGIHGTPQPSRIGLTQSHGCIRLTNWDAAELGKIVRVGTRVIIHAN